MKDVHGTDLFSVEAEQQLLGAVMLNNNLADKLNFLEPDHFYDAVHADIWRNVISRLSKARTVSPVTLQQDLVGHSGLQELGGAKYLARMAGASIGAHAAIDYGTMIVEMSERRQISDLVSEIGHGLSTGWDAGRAFSRLEIAMSEREDSALEPRTMSFLKAQTQAIERMVAVQQGASPGVPTGLRDLDEVLTLAPGRYTILGGATSMGKSALAMFIAHQAAKSGYGVGFVSLEMPEIDLANRINSIESKIPYKSYDRPMSETLMRGVIEAGQSLQDLPLHIFSDRVRDVPAILSEARRLQRKWAPNEKFQGLQLLVIDYLQLVRGKGESAFVRLSQVANDLKQIAKMLDVHVLALAQVGRDLGKVAHWREARPRLADLRGSGDLENAPDNVIFAFRPEYYLERLHKPRTSEELADWDAEMALWKGKMEIIIAKARMGEIGSVTVAADMGTNSFSNIDKQEDIDF